MSQSEKMNNDRSGQRIESMYFGLLDKLKLRRFFYFHKIRNRGFLKNSQNGKHAEGTAAGVSFCLPGVQRAGSPLCQGSKRKGKNDEYKNRGEHIYKENRADRLFRIKRKPTAICKIIYR